MTIQIQHSLHCRPEICRWQVLVKPPRPQSVNHEEEDQLHSQLVELQRHHAVKERWSQDGVPSSLTLIQNNTNRRVETYFVDVIFLNWMLRKASKAFLQETSKIRKYAYSCVLYMRDEELWEIFHHFQQVSIEVVFRSLIILHNRLSRLIVYIQLEKKIQFLISRRT